MRERTVYGFFNMLLLSVLALGFWGGSIGIAATSPAMVLLLIGISFLAVMIRNLEVRGRVALIVGALALAMLVGSILGWEHVAQFGRGYVYWAQNVGVWQEGQEEYELLQTFWVGLGCVALDYLLERKFLLKAAMAFLFAGFLVYFVVAEISLSKGYVMLAMVYLTTVATECLWKSWKRVRNGNMQAYVVWLIPFMLLYICAMALIPAREKPYDWQFVKELYTQVQEACQKIAQSIRYGKGQTYEFAYSGFSEEARLGNGLLEEDKEIMSIESRSGLKTNIYLMGKVYDTFDGRQWLQTNEDDDTERYIDTLETLYAAGRYDKQHQRDYLSRVTLDIRYRDFRSEYLFAPLKTWSLEQNGEKLAFFARGDSLLFPQAKGYGTEYEALFYQLNINHPRFDEFLNAPLHEDEEFLQELLANINSRTKSELTIQAVKEHGERIHALYGEEVQLSAKARAYVEQITAGTDNTIERLKAIERELSSFAYNRSLPELPETVDSAERFLDYFLLESREGYCVHFATAFVLLARAEGIPARYVQGFCVPMRAKGETLVYSNMAHAWPEVYVEGVGWIPFEPTPGFAQVRYTPWAVSGGAEDTSPTDTQRETDEHRPDMEQMMEESRNRENEEISSGVTEVDMALARRQLRRIGRILLVVLGVFIVGCLIALLFLRLLGKYRYGKKDTAGKYAEKIGQNMRLMEALGAGRREEETIEEWLRRVQDDPIPARTLEFLANYEILRYGGGTIGEERLAEALEAQRALLEQLRQRSRVGYWYFLYMRL